MPRQVRVWIAGVCAVGVWIAALAAVPAGAQPVADLPEELRNEPFELTADALSYEMERELYVARGRVKIVQHGRTLRADWAAFNRTTGLGVASGNVSLADGEDVVTADFVAFELDTVAGTLYGGALEAESTPFRAGAAEIEKTGPDTYRFREGRFTTCRCPDPEERVPWEISAEEADLQIEGYATAKNASVEILGVPVAWIPWLAFPVKTERQSGLLFPEFSFSSFNGFSAGLPFFWAIADEAGLILTPRYSTERGAGGAAFFDYAWSQESSGEVLAAFTRDQDIDAKTAAQPFGRNRWSLSGEHDWKLPGDLRFETDFGFASDNQVPFDFDELNSRRSDRYLRSEARLGRGFGELDALGVSVGAQFVDDLQSPDDLDRDRFVLQRWPTARVDLLPVALPGAPFLVPSVDVDYAWFEARERAEGELPSAVLGPGGLFLDTGIDALPNGIAGLTGAREPGGLPDNHTDDFATTGGSEGDGRFQEGEPLTDRGHRVIVHPRIAAPLDWRGIQVVPEVGWRQSLYDSRLRGFQERGYATARVDATTRLSRDFGGWRHVLEPRAGYALVASSSQRRDPLFRPATAVPLDRVRGLDLDAVVRDDADRVRRAQRATLGFDNRFYRNDSDGSSLLADVTLQGLFDIEEEVFDALILEGRAFPLQGLDLRFHGDLDPDEGRVDEALASATWSHPVGVSLQGEYRWARDIPEVFEAFGAGDRFDERSRIDHIQQLEAGVSLDLTARWNLRYQMAYSIEGDLVLTNRGVLEYLSRCECWAAGIVVSEDRTRGVDVKFVYRLVGFGDTPVRRSEGLLDGFGGLW
ncbi:MAG: LPS assembly protein LptD [Myxococcota bacterium]